eukprot:scaffold9355_cov94-Skeletonema_dohrnii-CCMP3373.AAC.3
MPPTLLAISSEVGAHVGCAYYHVYIRPLSTGLESEAGRWEAFGNREEKKGVEMRLEISG